MSTDQAERERAEAVTREITDKVARRVLLKSTAATCADFFHTAPLRNEPEAELPLDAFGAFDARDEGADRVELGAELTVAEMEQELNYMCPIQYGMSFEEERQVRGMPDWGRVAAVTAPEVVARAVPPTSYCCCCCGRATAADVQTPHDVYTVGYRVGGHVEAMRCTIAMAEMLVAKDFAEVTRRTAVCRTVRCMLAQNLLSFDHYEAWLISSTQRQQLERGTDRKDQGLGLSENLVFLRCLAVQQPSVLTEEQLLALFQWMIKHSQFIQEREKRFIATAMAVAESPDHFLYKFADPQSFVNRMASFPRNYAERVIFPHILRVELGLHKWKSAMNIILETAFPKPYDVVYARLCEDNWNHQGRPVKNGRRVHRVKRGDACAALFTLHGFQNAIKACVHANPSYVLRYEGTAETRTAKTGRTGERDVQQLEKLLSGTPRKAITVGHGAAGMPTCASRQNDSGVHPYERYRSVFLASGYDDVECDAMVRLFIDRHAHGNTVGSELQDTTDPRSLSKECAVLRDVQLYVPPVVKPAGKRKAVLARCDEMTMVPLKPKTKTKPAPRKD